MLEKDVSYSAPEITPVGGERTGVVGVNVSFLRCLDIVQGDRGLLVIVERWQQAGFDTDMQILHFRRIKAEIVPAQGTDADQLHLALEHVDEHRQFVEPGFAQELAPAVDAIVVRELSAILKPFILKHIRLQVLGV